MRKNKLHAQQNNCSEEHIPPKKSIFYQTVIKRDVEFLYIYLASNILGSEM